MYLNSLFIILFKYLEKLKHKIWRKKIEQYKIGSARNLGKIQIKIIVWGEGIL